MRHTINFSICLSYSNSVCELLILSLPHPPLIIIAIYRPPSSTVADFVDIIDRVSSFIISLPPPMPHIIMLGDFNMPGFNWLCQTSPSSHVQPLIDLASLLFINQQVNSPTRISNILDLYSAAMI